MANELSISQKKEWAEMLYMQNQLSQKEIADKVQVAQSTLSKWVTKGNWENLRKSLLTTRQEMLSFLYNVLSKLKEKINGEDGIGNTKDADMVVKYAAAIRSLEIETSIAELMDCGLQFHKYLQTLDPLFALSVLNHFDSFIKHKMKAA